MFLRFIQVETAFFWRWWNEQNIATQDRVKELVSNGQLVLTGGGWCMNDEAAAHYTSIIENMGYGMQILNNIFGMQ